MVRPVSFIGFQKGFQGGSDFPLGIMCLYQIPQLRGSGSRQREFPDGIIPVSAQNGE